MCLLACSTDLKHIKRTRTAKYRLEMSAYKSLLITSYTRYMRGTSVIDCVIAYTCLAVTVATRVVTHRTRSILDAILFRMLSTS